MPSLHAEVFDVRRAGLTDPQAVQPEQNRERGVCLVVVLCGEQEHAKLRAIQPTRIGRVYLWAADVLRGVRSDATVDVRETIEATHRREPSSNPTSPSQSSSSTWENQPTALQDPAIWVTPPIKARGILTTVNGADVRGNTRVFIHLGSPIVHARAPGMFNAELRRRGFDAVLVPLDVPASGLPAAFSTLEAAANVGGLLVTMPHKAAVVGFCEEVGREAQFVGAANAVRFDPERVASCEMFDGVGLLGALDLAGVILDDADILLVGCGGAGSAIAGALTSRPIGSLTLHNRSNGSAEQLAARLEPHHGDVRVARERPAARRYGLVINATRLGMQPDDDQPVDLVGATSCTIADIVTGDQRSPLLQHADALGLPTIDGADMLRAQMSSIIDYWTGSV